MRILAIDFETANNNPVSACAVGYCLWENGTIAEEGETLIRPYRFYNQFTERHVQIHGITKDMVMNAPNWPTVYDRIRHLFENSFVIAHNASFDINVLKSVSELFNIKLPPFNYVDTVRIARKVHPEFPNYKLNTICDCLNVELNHHNAFSDAKCCMAIVMDAFKQKGTDNMETLLKELKIKPETLEQDNSRVDI